MALMISHEDRAHALEAFRGLNDSPMQRKLRDARWWFVGPVYWKPGDYDSTALRNELRRIRDVGFTIVRFHTAGPTRSAGGAWDFGRTDDWMAAAGEAGLGVALHLPIDKPADFVAGAGTLTPGEIRNSWWSENSRIRAVLEDCLGEIAGRYARHPALVMYGGPGEPDPEEGALDEEDDRARFGEWLAARYGTVEALDGAWNLYPVKGSPITPSFADAWRVLEGYRAAPKITGVHRTKVNYGAARDLRRYLTDRGIDRARLVVELIRKYDPDHPVGLGSHQLLLNPAFLNWDFGKWARSADLHFSSIHLSWHHDVVGGEVDRPVYIQARRSRDYFKYGCTSAYETTGGAVQYSGGYGNAMSAGLMRRLMLSYLAAGNVSIAFWTWNHRPGGWEAGEYGMTSLSGRITAWAREAGMIARAIERHAAELWDADHEPEVGILEVWDTDAILTLEPERHDLRGGIGLATGTAQQATRARVGAARALMNAHVSFEFLSVEELLQGIACRYPAIYVPHARAISREALDALAEYVRKGGRLVADVQFAFMDQWGKLQAMGEGGAQERIFGAFVDTVHDSRTETMRAGGVSLEGLFGEIVTTEAVVITHFDDGRAAVTSRALGKGHAVLVGYDAARMCWAPGNDRVEEMLVDAVLGERVSGWHCSAPLAFRLMSSSADHYFLVNDGDECRAALTVSDRSYTGASDAITGEPVALPGGDPFVVPARSGRWLRLFARR